MAHITIQINLLSKLGRKTSWPASCWSPRSYHSWPMSPNPLSSILSTSKLSLVDSCVKKQLHGLGQHTWCNKIFIFFSFATLCILFSLSIMLQIQLTPKKNTKTLPFWMSQNLVMTWARKERQAAWDVDATCGEEAHGFIDQPELGADYRHTQRGVAIINTL